MPCSRAIRSRVWRRACAAAGKPRQHRKRCAESRPAQGWLWYVLQRACILLDLSAQAAGHMPALSALDRLAAAGSSTMPVRLDQVQVTDRIPGGDRLPLSLRACCDIVALAMRRGAASRVRSCIGAPDLARLLL